MKTVTIDYRDVNDNKIKFEGKTTANIIDGKEKQLELLVTTKQTHPLLGLDWMGKLGITLNTDNNTQTIKHITGKPNQINCNSEREITALKSKFHKSKKSISDHGNDKDGKREGTKFSTIEPTLHTFQTPFYSREEQTPQQSRLFQSKTRTGRIWKLKRIASSKK